MVLITGATGNVGREVVNLLLAEGVKVAAVSRNPETAMLPSEVQATKGNPSEPQSIASALDGVEALLLSPRAVDGAVGELVTLAASKGVRRAVVLSALTAQYGGGYQRFADGFRAFEDAAKNSGVDWTVLRSADYASNAKAWLPQIRTGDVVRGAYGDAATSAIHERDVAAVAARALVESSHIGRTYVLTGPQSLTQRERLAAIGGAIKRNLTWRETSPEEIRQAMIANGLPPDVPDRMLGYFADYVHKSGPSTDTVRDLLGRPALTFAKWAAEHAAEFRG